MEAGIEVMQPQIKECQQLDEARASRGSTALSTLIHLSETDLGLFGFQNHERTNFYCFIIHLQCDKFVTAATGN